MTLQPCDNPPGSDLTVAAASAVVVPIEEYRRLRALESHAATDDLEVAEADAILQGHWEWVAAGRPGALSHDDVMAELLLG